MEAFFYAPPVPVFFAESEVPREDSPIFWECAQDFGVCQFRQTAPRN